MRCNGKRNNRRRKAYSDKENNFFTCCGDTYYINFFSYSICSTRKNRCFFVDFFEKYVKLIPDETSDNWLPYQKVIVDYIPEGFSKTRCDEGYSLLLYEWKNGENIITLQSGVFIKGDIILDTENSDYLVLTIGNLTVHRTEKYDQISATWTDEKMLYTLSATGVEWDEMINIIESIKIEE